MKKGLFIGLILLLAIIHLSAAVTINNINTTPSVCPATGSMDVVASGSNPPFIYSIIAGPLTRPSQSNSDFQALPAGIYTVVVQNQIGESDTVGGVQITGTYQPMTASPLAYPCSASGQSFLVGNLTGGGIPPYTWELIPPSPVTAPPQVSDTFYNLPSGNYSVRVTDDCGIFQTYSATMPADSINFRSWSYSNRIYCNDAGSVTININYDDILFPFTISITDSLGNTVSAVINSYTGYLSIPISCQINTLQDRITIWADLPYLPYGGGSWSLEITAPCSDTFRLSGHTADTLSINPSGVLPDSCSGKQTYSFTARNLDDGRVTQLPDTLKWYLYDVTLGAVVDSGYFYGTAYRRLTTGTPGETYQLLMEDNCGNNYISETWVWDVPPPPVVGYTTVGHECLDSTVAMVLLVGNMSTSNTLRWIIKSGPTTMQSTKPGFEYTGTLQYPDTFDLPVLYGLDLRNLPVGTYTFSTEHLGCGLLADSSFTITPNMVNSKSYTFESTGNSSCGLNNGLRFEVDHGRRLPNNLVYYNISYRITNVGTGQVIDEDSILNTFSDNYPVLPGTYALELHFLEVPQVPIYLNNNDFCTSIYDTLVIAPFGFPEDLEFINSFCQDTIVTLVYADSSSSVPPYAYEVIAGPQTFPAQTSNRFNLPSIGTYTFRIIDSCGNSHVSSTDIDTLLFPPIDVTNTPCAGANVQLIPLISPFYSYEWLSPAGTIYLGDTLSISGVTAADTGLYTITRYADIDGCLDTVQTTLRLEMAARITQDLAVCVGQTVTVGGNTYTTSGTYIDTLTATLGCDSIITTNLSVVTEFNTNFQMRACVGDTVTVNNQTYIAIDTSTQVFTQNLVALGGCDSIITTTLFVSDNFYNHLSMDVCADDTIQLPIELAYNSGTIYDTISVTGGQTWLTGLYQFPGGCLQLDSTTFYSIPKAFSQVTESICSGGSVNGHNTSGTYIDTFQSYNSCDSIVTLTLNVSNLISDTVNYSLCPGESVLINGTPYNQSTEFTDTFSLGGCDSIIHNIVTAHVSQPIEGVASPDSVAAGEPVQLTVDLLTDHIYSWSPAEQLSNSQTYNPITQITESTWFTVVATDTVTQCQVSDSVLVKLLDEECSKHSLYIPNVYTPNVDGINDEFQVFTNCPIADFRILIFDRWGEKVFESNTEHFRWDGTYKGEKLPPDVFVYYISGKFSNGEPIERKGSVLLLR